jgi:hypothetical protein
MVVRCFSLKIPGHGLITIHNTIFGWKHKFEASGCVTNLTPVAPATANIEENGDKRRESLQGSPSRSGRQKCHVLGICRRSLERTLQNIKFYYLYFTYMYVCVF